MVNGHSECKNSQQPFVNHSSKKEGSAADDDESDTSITSLKIDKDEKCLNVSPKNNEVRDFIYVRNLTKKCTNSLICFIPTI